MRGPLRRFFGQRMDTAAPKEPQRPPCPIPHDGAWAHSVGLTGVSGTLSCLPCARRPHGYLAGTSARYRDQHRQIGRAPHRSEWIAGDTECAGSRWCVQPSVRVRTSASCTTQSVTPVDAAEEPLRSTLHHDQFPCQQGPISRIPHRGTSASSRADADADAPVVDNHHF